MTSASFAPGPSWPPVSVVMCVLNEERHLSDSVRSVMEQDYPGEIELVVALGPSLDATAQIAATIAAAQPRVRTVPNPSGTTPAGLNLAIAEARHGVIARVDGHSVLPPDYVRVAIEELRRTGADNVGGLMAAEGSTAFERAVARAMTSRLGVGNAAFHTGGEAGPTDTVYLGVFRRSAVERVGGYDESFMRAQDWEMNLRIRQTGGQVWFTPRMRVSYRPRGSVRSLARQYFYYGRWRRVVMRQHRGTATPRYLAPPAALLGVAVGLAVAPVWWPAILVPAAYVVGVTVGSMAVSGGLPPAARLRLPVVLATMHGAWGAGFLTSPRGLGAATPRG